MATPDPPRGSGTVTVASQGAAAFVGDVYYLADGRTGDPILGWPPRPPPVGFSRGDARDADDGPDAFGRTKAQREGDRVLLATNAADATRALRRFREACFPSPPGGERASDDDDDAVASLASAARINRALGPSAYFPDRAFATQWAEVVNRPCGLSYFKHARRRLRRPSDKPLLPNGIAVQSAPFARAYGNLVVGWNNAALAAKRGVAASLSARRDAADVLFARSDLDPERVMGANPEIAGDGNAETLAPLLTGYDDFLPFAPFEEDFHEKETREENLQFGAGTRREARPRVNAWLVEDLSSLPLETFQTASERSFSFDDASGTPYPSSGSWRAVAARVEERDANEKRKKTSSSRDEPNSSSSNENDGMTNTATSDVEAVALGGRTEWWAKTFFDDAFSFSGKVTPREALDRLVAARAVDRESVSVGECPRRVSGPRHRPPADTPVFSSPLVHVVAPGMGSNGSSSTPVVSRETTEPSRSPSPRGDDDATTTTTRGGTVSVSDEGFETDDSGSSPTYPLGVKLAMSDETTGAVTVTSAQMYRPWFFNVEDLRAMVRAAIKAEAEARVARNKARREKTNRALAAMLTAVCHTKPNPRLSGFQMPGLDGSNRGSAGKGSGGVGGGVYGGAGDDDDEPEDDDDDPRNEGLEDDDDGSLNDDELMKEYMREMVKDGTAEDALGSWARDAARAAKEARENAAKGRGKSGDRGDDANASASEKFSATRWLPSFLRPRTETEKETYQQLDVSPFAHAGLVFAVTAYYAWNVSRSFCGDALDRAFLSTNFGRWALVIDTPLADAAENIEVGSFEGVCCAAVAEAAADDIRRRYEANAKARSALTARLRMDVAAASEAKRRAVAAENAVAAAAERHLDALDALGKQRGGQRGRGGDDEEVVPESQAGGRADPEDVSDRRGDADASASASTPSRRARRGGFLRAIPLLRRIPVLGAKASETGSDEPLSTRRAVTVETVDDDDAFAAVPTADLELGVFAATRARDDALAAWSDAREHTLLCLRLERDARRALLDAVSEEVRDNVDALRFTEATRDALARAERARVANATAFHPDAAKKEASSTDGEDAEDAESAENATRSPSATTNASLSAPPLFVANLPEGNTLGDGSQAADDGSGGRLRGFIGTGKYSRVRRL